MEDAFKERLCQDRYLSEVATALNCLSKRLYKLQGDYMTVLSPVRHLPFDVLAEICTHAQNDEEDTHIFDTASPPWSLAQVCHFWRGTVQGLPALWSNIRLMVPPCNASHLLNTALTYSSSHPLSILFQYTPSTLTTVEDAIRLFTILAQEAHRWESLELRVPPSFNSSLESLGGRLHTLYRLQYRSEREQDNQSADREITYLHAFNTAQNLKHVLFSAVHPTIRIHLPWHQLSDFFDDREDDPSIHQYFLEGIKRGVKLEKLKVSQLESLAEQLTGAIVTNSSILELQACSPVFLRKLKLPKLMVLTISPNIDEEIDQPLSRRPCSLQSLSAAHELITSSQCALQSLTLRYVELNKETLFQALFVLPQLIELTFFTSPVALAPFLFRDLLLRLTDSTRSSNGQSFILMPRLCRLSITLLDISHDDHIAFVGQPLVNMLAARYQDIQDPHLKYVLVKGVEVWMDPDYFFRLSPECVSTLNKWKDKDLEIEVVACWDEGTIDLLNDVE